MGIRSIKAQNGVWLNVFSNRVNTRTMEGRFPHAMGKTTEVEKLTGDEIGQWLLGEEG